MTTKELQELVDRWAESVRRLWNETRQKAKDGHVPVPESDWNHGPYCVVVDRDGIYLTFGATELARGENKPFSHMIDSPEFPLTKLDEMASIVHDAVRNGAKEVDRLIQEREALLQKDWKILREGVAEWNLSSKHGEEA